jgi:hypothetical protein
LSLARLVQKIKVFYTKQYLYYKWLSNKKTITILSGGRNGSPSADSISSYLLFTIPSNKLDRWHCSPFFRHFLHRRTLQRTLKLFRVEEVRSVSEAAVRRRHRRDGQRRQRRKSRGDETPLPRVGQLVQKMMTKDFFK